MQCARLRLQQHSNSQCSLRPFTSSRFLTVAAPEREIATVSLTYVFLQTGTIWGLVDKTTIERKKEQIQNRRVECVIVVQMSLIERVCIS
jgi:hypothetical protein